MTARCAWCNAALKPDGPSPDFDSEQCADAWRALYGDPLPPGAGWRITADVDVSGFTQALIGLRRAMDELGEAFARGLTDLARALGEVGAGHASDHPPADERRAEVQRAALEARRNRNTGPPVPPPGARRARRP